MTEEKTPRRSPLTSAKEMHRIASAANKVIDPHSNTPITDEQRVFFDRIISEKAKADWTDHQLDLAAVLARVLCQLNIETEKMCREGLLIKESNGKVVQSPRKRAVETLMKVVVDLRRSLGIHARSMGNGQKQAFGEHMDLAKRIEAGFIGEEDDDFLGRDDLVN